MATIKKPIKKAQAGTTALKKGNSSKSEVVSKMYSTLKKKGELALAQEKENQKRKEEAKPKMVGTYKKGGAVKKAKSGGSFPDLNKDGKITKADILKGRGVIAKKGKTIAKKKAGTHKMPDGSIMKNSMMKSGGKMKKCAYGCK